MTAHTLNVLPLRSTTAHRQFRVDPAIFRAIRPPTACTRSRVLRTVVRSADDGPESPTKKRPSFKYDQGMQRWVKDTKNEMSFDDPEFDPTVVPKSGAAYTLWPVCHSDLVERDLQSVSGEEALELVKRGAILVDVREARHFEQCHCQDAINLPLFQPVSGNSMFDNMKRLAMAAFAMQATERNPEFAAQALQTLDTEKKIILSCGTGGTLKTEITRTTTKRKKVYADPERSFGRESRSLKAAYELFQAGFTDIVHLEGGFNQWRHDDLPTYYAD